MDGYETATVASALSSSKLQVIVDEQQVEGCSLPPNILDPPLMSSRAYCTMHEQTSTFFIVVIVSSTFVEATTQAFGSIDAQTPWISKKSSHRRSKGEFAELLQHREFTTLIHLVRTPDPTGPRRSRRSSTSSSVPSSPPRLLRQNCS